MTLEGALELVPAAIWLTVIGLGAPSLVRLGRLLSKLDGVAADVHRINGGLEQVAKFAHDTRHEHGERIAHLEGKA